MAATLTKAPMRYSPATTRSLLVAALALLTLPACGWIRRDPSVTVRVQGDARMNFVNDRPNAAVVRIYKHASRANFDRASRAALWQDDSAALGGELLARREVTLLPEAQEALELELRKGARFVAVAADFYNPDGDGWRVVYPASPKKPIRVRLGERQISSR